MSQLSPWESDPEDSRPPLIEVLKTVIPSCAPFRRDVVKEVSALLFRAAKEYRSTVFADDKTVRTEGPCIMCGQEITFPKASPPHLKRGDGWLRELYSITGREALKRWAWTTLWPYVCPGCTFLIEEQRADEDAIATEQRDWELQQHHANLARRAEAARFWLLSEWDSQDSQVSVSSFFWDAHNAKAGTELRALKYRDFLRTTYWNYIRRHKLYRAKYRCELCSGNNLLNVHHKTYKHHGEEHDYLEDLIVLCRPCHAKFHDKVAECPQEKTA